MISAGSPRGLLTPPVRAGTSMLRLPRATGKRPPSCSYVHNDVGVVASLYFFREFVMHADG